MKLFDNMPFLNFSTYNRFWREAESAISDLLIQELPAEPRKPEKVSDMV